MKNNKIFIIIIGILLVILIGVGILIVTQKQGEQSSNFNSEEKNEEQENTNDLDQEDVNSIFKYVCEMEQDATTPDFKIISQETLMVEDNLIKENNKSTKMIFNDDVKYKNYKESNLEQDNLVFDDPNLTVIDNSNITEEDEINSSLTYEEYQAFIESIGYTCKPES